MESLTESLLQLYPLPPDVKVVPTDRLPPPRVALYGSTADALEKCADPLEDDRNFYSATVKGNTRITVEGWYQDVRHLEFEFSNNLRCVGPTRNDLV